MVVIVFYLHKSMLYKVTAKFLILTLRYEGDIMYFSRAISCTVLPKGGHYGSYCPAVCTVGGKYGMGVSASEDWHVQLQVLGDHQK